jgi:alpha-glucosidase
MTLLSARRVALLAALLAPALGAPSTLGDVASVTCAGSTCAIVAKVAGDASATVPLRLVFFAPSIVRYWLAVDGNFSDDGCGSDVIVGQPQNVVVALRDAGAYYEITQQSASDAAAAAAPSVTAQLQKSPCQLTLLVDTNAVVHEVAPLAWDDALGTSTQTLARDSAPFPEGLSAEYFFGGGMQNGRFSHRDASIQIGVDYNWEDGGHPNSVPFYVSTAGYGVFRNTWAPGAYTFASPVVTVHNESTRFDAFFVLAAPGDIKSLLGLYTMLTGPPFLPPIYGMFLGDSDCYHNERHGNSTQVAIAVAKLYNQFDMPHGWMLINDGYGCGYGEGPETFPTNLTDLTYVVAQLHEQGMYTGLWTSTGMPNIQGEVGIAGTRICKTDVGWIGDGYKYDIGRLRSLLLDPLSPLLIAHAVTQVCVRWGHAVRRRHRAVQHAAGAPLRLDGRGLGRHAPPVRLVVRRRLGRDGLRALADPDVRRLRLLGAGARVGRHRRHLRRLARELRARPAV